MALTTTTNPGSQSTAADNNLQSTVAANGVSGGTPSSIQPGTNNSVLLNTGGIPLSPGALSTVSLGSAASQTTVAAPVHHHKISPGLLGFALAMFVFAVGLFWYMSRAEKNTTI